MNDALAAERTTVRTGAAMLACCTVLALANLPSDDLPLGWLAAFVLPGAALAWLARWTPRPWQRTTLAILLQTSACLLALHFVGPMSRPAALACTILPPLGFATARSQPTDQALALFLAFCVLLVGVILDGLHAGLVAAFCLAACFALRCASRLAVLAASRPIAPSSSHRTDSRPLAGGLRLGLLCLLAVLAVDRTLEWLPSPSRRAENPRAQAGSGPRRVGLDDSFDLGGTRGLLSELTGEQLVKATTADADGVPRDLYLRSGFFTVPGAERWQLGELELRSLARSDRHVMRTPWPDMAVQRLELERFAGARNFVFVPPHTCRIAGILHLQVDTTREWIRQNKADDGGPYAVDWQSPPPLPPNTTADPRWRALGLCALPRDLDRTPFEALLTEWGVGSEPLPAMERIAAGLARHCRYDRIEPTGPFASAIENFLFAASDRRGYCMHFATAAALLLRLRGIPCRIGVGLYGGDRDPDEPTARLFGSQHAHAWVEVPFPDRGFYVYDPTPAAERGQRMPTRLDPSAEQNADGKRQAAAATDWWAALVDLVSQPWVLTLLMAMLLAASLWPHRVRLAPELAAPPAARSARRLLARLLQALAKAGHPRRRGQTLEMLAHELSREGRLPPEVGAAFGAYQQVRFGGRPFDPERERTLHAGIVAAAAMPATAIAMDAPAPSV